MKLTYVTGTTAPIHKYYSEDNRHKYTDLYSTYIQSSKINRHPETSWTFYVRMFHIYYLRTHGFSFVWNLVPWQFYTYTDTYVGQYVNLYLEYFRSDHIYFQDSPYPCFLFVLKEEHSKIKNYGMYQMYVLICYKGNRIINISIISQWQKDLFVYLDYSFR